MNKIKLICVLFFVMFGVAALFIDNSLVPTVESFSSNPPIGATGAPGEFNCALCHSDTPQPGVFVINAPATYVPGQTYQMQAQHTTTDATRLRWGFEMTSIDSTELGAGIFTSLDGFTSTDIDNSNFRSYVLHTSTGTFPGTSNGATWTFDWTAPATNVGPVTFYAAGNQANNNNNSDGDWIYLTNTVTIGPTPTVTDISPNSGPTVGGNAATITGTNFISPASVTIGGNPGLNVIIVNSTTLTVTVPAGTTGPANVVVTTPNGASNSVFYTYADPTPTNTNTPTPTPTCFTVTTLSGTQEVPPNGSTGTGTGTVSVNAAQTQITVTLTWSGLSSNANAAHIHGPAAAGSNAGVLFGMAGVPASPTGSISPASQTFAITPTQLTQFQNGLFYWNVHSANFGAGEIRGQILPGPCLASPTPTATATLTPTNTATATNTPTATPTGAETPSISGTVRYGNPASPTTKLISNANITITCASGPPVSATTGPPGASAGQYVLTGFGTPPCTVGVTKTTGQNGVSSGDAARIAQHVSGISLIVPDPQKVAADVTNNGGLSSTDAAQIARFVAGLGPPIGITNQWRFFVPPGPTFPIGASLTTRTYNDPIGVQTNQDFIGLLIGEVTGNWAPGPLRPVGNYNGPEAADDSNIEPKGTITVNMPEVAAQMGSEIIIPVNVQGVADKEIISYEFDLRYDPSVIQPQADPVDVAGTVSRGLSVVTNAETPGLLRVVMYGAMPIDQDGLLLNFRFTTVGVSGSVSPITFERIMFNEGEPSIVLTNGLVEVLAKSE
ncbi:MAG: choice-of-anchor V domain-containing protein [Pyrinomonadaceae bacterium]